MQSAMCCCRCRKASCLEELVQQVPIVLLALQAVHIAVAVQLNVGREVAGEQFCHKEPICKISAGKPSASACGSSNNERWHMQRSIPPGMLDRVGQVQAENPLQQVSGQGTCAHLASKCAASACQQQIRKLLVNRTCHATSLPMLSQERIPIAPDLNV